jgi:hypothetical protein
MDENTSESAALYADFAKVASKNSMAWTFGRAPATEQDIKTVSKENRMICLPCMEVYIEELDTDCFRSTADECF